MVKDALVTNPTGALYQYTWQNKTLCDSSLSLISLKWNVSELNLANTTKANTQMSTLFA